MKANEEWLTKLATEAAFEGLSTALQAELGQNRKFLAGLEPVIAEAWLRMRLEQIRAGREDLQFVIQVVIPREKLQGFLSGGTIVGTTILHGETLQEELMRFSARVKAALKAVPNTTAYLDFRVVGNVTTEETPQEVATLRHLFGDDAQ